MIFWAKSEIEADGKPKLSMGSDHNRARFSDDLRKNPHARYRIERITPESKKQRNFFEGAVVPMVCYYQEGFDYNNSDDNKAIRGWLSLEFNGEFKTMAGKAVKVAKSTKGELNRGFLERITDWMQEQGYQTELLMPADYKKWKNEVFPYGGPAHYIDYLLEKGLLKRR